MARTTGCLMVNCCSWQGGDGIEGVWLFIYGTCNMLVVDVCKPYFSVGLCCVWLLCSYKRWRSITLKWWLNTGLQAANCGLQYLMELKLMGRWVAEFGIENWRWLTICVMIYIFVFTFHKLKAICAMCCTLFILAPIIPWETTSRSTSIWNLFT